MFSAAPATRTGRRPRTRAGRDHTTAEHRTRPVRPPAHRSRSTHRQSDARSPHPSQSYRSGRCPPRRHDAQSGQPTRGRFGWSSPHTTAGVSSADTRSPARICSRCGQTSIGPRRTRIDRHGIRSSMFAIRLPVSAAAGSNETARRTAGFGAPDGCAGRLHLEAAPAASGQRGTPHRQRPTSRLPPRHFGARLSLRP